MKKIIVLMMAVFLVFSFNGYSQNKTHKTVKSAKTEQPKKGNAKTRRTPRKSVSRNKIHKAGTNRHSKTKSGNAIKV